jgi:hypothetical protein
MMIYQIEDGAIMALTPTTFARQDLMERTDLQQMLKQQIDVISPGTLVVAEEFGDWEDSRRRIDLLGIDKDANLVVIELKRTETGGHMELQAVRYAAMISTLTFSKLVSIYEDFIAANDLDSNPEEELLAFLEWDEPDEEQFGQEVRIVLASAEFSKELTTSVMWLNDYGLDIRCVRMRPYESNGKVLIDVQTVIPIPEVADYQVLIREKKQRERESRKDTRDLTKYDVTVDGVLSSNLPKRRAFFLVVQALAKRGHTPEAMWQFVPTGLRRGWRWAEGELDSPTLVEACTASAAAAGRTFRPKRWYVDDDELIYAEGKTWAFSRMWGTRMQEYASRIIEGCSEHGIELQQHRE